MSIYKFVVVTWKRILICSVLSFSASLIASAQRSGTFPLKMSLKHNYLADSKNQPFLIKEISAWGLIQALSEKDEAAFIDSVKRKGFNTLLVSLISNDARFAGDPPNWQGVAPFTTKGDFSTFNTAYFDHADKFLRMAELQGMLVLLAPCYLGSKDEKSEGWWSQLMGSDNSIAKSRSYGQFLGKRYKDFQNIIWVAGGDNKGDSTLHDHMENIIQGIEESDTRHLWTGHFESKRGTNWSLDNPLYAKYMDIDGLYDFVESDLGKDGPQYKSELNRFGKGKVLIQLDQSYEHDVPHSADNENEQRIRRKNYDGLLSGCAGTSFCPGQKNNPEYVLKNWRPLMNTEGMTEMKYCFNLFQSRSWHNLIPDTTNTIITEGRGVYGTINYVCAAQVADHSTYIAYLPLGGPVSVNLNALKVKEITAWWYDPRNGKSLPIGTFTADGVQEFNALTSEDWILVIDNAALKLPAPRN
jgi:hypothetical protein